MQADEVLELICQKFEKANDMPLEEGNKLRYEAKVIFDKRFTNPDRCPTCRKVNNG
jgi:hypothetical protein